MDELACAMRHMYARVRRFTLQVLIFSVTVIAAIRDKYAALDLIHALVRVHVPHVVVLNKALMLSIVVFTPMILWYYTLKVCCYQCWTASRLMIGLAAPVYIQMERGQSTTSGWQSLADTRYL
jgi:hypothetical protein